MKVCSTCARSLEGASACAAHPDAQPLDDSDPATRKWAHEEQAALKAQRVFRNDTLAGAAGLVIGAVVAASLLYVFSEQLFPIPAGRKSHRLLGFWLVALIAVVPPLLGLRWGLRISEGRRGSEET